MAFDEAITGGTTSKIIEVMVRDSTTGQGKTGLAHGDVTASYCREGGTRTAISLVSGTAGDSYSSGKWCEVDSTNQKGLYQLHVPNAAIAVGVAASTVTLQASGMIDKSIRLKLQTPVKVVEVETDAIDADSIKADAVAKVQNGLALSSEVSDLETDIAIVQSTIDGIIDSDGVVLDTNQPNYAPAKQGEQMDLVNSPNATAVTVIQSGLGTFDGQTTIQTTQTAHTSSLATLNSGVVSILAKLLAYFRLALRSDAAPTTDDATELAEINGDSGSGAGDYDRTNSLESIRDNQSSGGGGGGTNLVVAPVVGVITQRSTRSDFDLFVGEVIDNRVAVIDASGDPVDLSGRTLKIVIEDGRSHDDLQLIEDGDISVSGDDSNLVTFRNSTDVTATSGSRIWSLWDITSSPVAEILTRGKIQVKYAGE